MFRRSPPPAHSLSTSDLTPEADPEIRVNPFQTIVLDPSRVKILNTIPTIVTKDSIKGLPMPLAIVGSILLHILSPLALLAATLLTMLLMGLNIADFFHHFDKPKDLEFVLVPNTVPIAKPLDPNTKYRAVRDSQAGGVNDPFKPVDLTPTNHAVDSRNSKSQADAEKTSAEPTPKPIHPTAPKPKMTNPKDRAKAAALSQLNAKQHPKDTSPQAFSGNTLPTPKLAHANSGSVGGVNSDSSFNPGAGSKNGPAGVDARKDPNFGPYMQDLQRRIRESWHPPRGNESKKVVVVFEIDRSGKLRKLNIVKSSGEPTADQAALAAVRQTFPYRPLPSDYTDPNIDIEFTFDYKIFGEKINNNT